MKYFWIIILFVSFASGCTVIRNSQQEDLAEFAHMAIKVADVPGDIYTRYYELNHQYKILNSASQFMDAPKVTDAISDLELKEEDIAMDDAKIHAFKVQYEIMKKFAALLMAMTDPVYRDNFVKEKDDFMTSFNLLSKKCNTLFPTSRLPSSLGGLVGSLVQEIGSRSIQYMQRKYLVQLLKEAEPSFTAICNFYIDQHAKEIELLCRNLKEETDHAFSTYVNNIKNDNQSGNNLLLYQDRLVPLYQSWQAKVKIIRQLSDNQIESMEKLRDAYNAMQHSLVSKMTLREMIPEMGSLYNSFGNIRDAYEQYADEMKRIRDSRPINNSEK